MQGSGFELRPLQKKYDITFANKVNTKAKVIRTTPTTKEKTWISEYSSLKYQ